ncbi:PP2C family protein-serine/threonine phosphatase [Planctellipticum variicoloris]|uniref:PP2C family protein-serine/threonine phosphatase n=1 Tax=Planctellipticum variicoloris TaxID=3064265 RepID=UPI003013FF85|nr:SpoIIE family protein phosphatase [Planctomycetaceae bacterium SH412]
MLAAPIPAHETERLAELRALKILDSPREDRFDILVRLARHMFRVPIAYIALVDAERQWFKAQEGLDVDETPRSISFCGHAINQDGPLIVRDALLDSRFADNPLVTGGPRVRFYAGHPLSGPTGYKVGTLCLVDHEAREFDEHHQVGLTYLAGLVEQQLHMVDLIGTQRELLETKTALVAAQDRLNRELQEAREYICSQLPARTSDGPVRIDWTFASSSELGGDLFGDFWLDEDRLAIYLIDVCGHGVGAALHSSSVQSAIRRQTLPGCDFADPGCVLAALDRAFPMDEHHGKFFTIWYGVYEVSTRTLKYAAAGHPPAYLYSMTAGKPAELGTPDLMVGVIQDREAAHQTINVPAGARLYVFSDGVFEIFKSDGSMVKLEGLRDLLRSMQSLPAGRTAATCEELQRMQGQPTFVDDFSLVELEFV